MPDPNPDALSFLLTRRSRPAKTLVGPYPDRNALSQILTAGARSPDHGKLEPWRFIVLEGAALQRLGALAETRGTARGVDHDQIAKMKSAFDAAGCIVAVVAVEMESEKVPAIEQSYSAGAVCLSLLNAALASGWGANWLTGWAAHDVDFTSEGLGLAPYERIAGFIHIGTESAAPPDRPRPDLSRITQWMTR